MQKHRIFMWFIPTLVGAMPLVTGCIQTTHPRIPTEDDMTAYLKE